MTQSCGPCVDYRQWGISLFLSVMQPLLPCGRFQEAKFIVVKVVCIFVLLLIERKIIFTRNCTCLYCPQPRGVTAHAVPDRASDHGFLTMSI